MNLAKLFKALRGSHSSVLKQEKGNGSRRDFFLNPKKPPTSGYCRIRTPDPLLQRRLTNPLGHGGK